MRKPADWTMWSAIIMGVGATAGGGCGGPEKLVPPKIEPQKITAALMQQADADGSGALSRAELNKVPGLIAAAGNLDTDRDGSLSAAEIETWFHILQKAHVAVRPLVVVVTQRSKPLADVLVKLVPEPFMGPDTKPAEGRTSAAGQAAPAVPGGRFSGVHDGIFRVELHGNDADGKPLPARWNSGSGLGVAVGGSLPASSMVTFVID